MASVSAPIYNPMMTVPASYNPPVPYQGNIPGGLGSNQTVVIKGQVPKNAHRFAINFKVGHSDIALHISPRMDENSVVRNSFLNGGWGHEERELPFNPFHRGLDFDLSIRHGKEWFEIFSKGQPFFTFMHRFRNFQRIDTLEIQGDVILSQIQF